MNQDGEVTAPPVEKPSPAPAPGPAADKPVTAPWQRELLEKKKVSAREAAVCNNNNIQIVLYCSPQCKWSQVYTL